MPALLVEISLEIKPNQQGSVSHAVIIAMMVTNS